MTDVERIIALARKQVGVSEQPAGSNNVKYNTDYYGHHVEGGAYAWCVVFIWWLFDFYHLNSEFCGGTKTAYCPFVVNYAKNNGAWITDPSKFRAGDCLLFDWNGDNVADHIGLLVSWNGASGQTIEGNAGDAVSLCTRSVGQIIGAYRPAYRNAEIPAETPTGPADSTPSTKIDCSSLISLISRSCFSCLSNHPNSFFRYVVNPTKAPTIAAAVITVCHVSVICIL